jgi:hypothetical protein
LTNAGATVHRHRWLASGWANGSTEDGGIRRMLLQDIQAVQGFPNTPLTGRLGLAFHSLVRGVNDDLPVICGPGLPRHHPHREQQSATPTCHYV